MAYADYPRPMLRRKEWTDLSGIWDFEYDDERIGEHDKWYKGLPSPVKINVPFTYQTERSGINDKTYHPVVWYSKALSLDFDKLSKQRLILIFEGADFFAKVWVNGMCVGSHKGGYARFSFDVTDYVNPGTDNLVVVRCEDVMNPAMPRGKQRWATHNYACWYVENTGLWKTVWMEYVPKVHISSIKLTPNLKTASLEAEIVINGKIQRETLNATVFFKDTEITNISLPLKRNVVKLNLPVEDYEENEWGVHRWRLGNPELYDLMLTVGDDNVTSYFAMREIEIDNGRVLLNGESIFQRLILDQGYWPDSGLTPPSVKALEEDIDKCMALGFNGARKHQKIEDERFLYLCDKKGYLIWSEMAASYSFDDEAVTEFTSEWMEIVRQNYSHPCIITWTPFNESWGVRHIRSDKAQQAFTEAIYNLTKAYDQMRPVIVNDGWEHTISDILTLHDYEEEGKELYYRYTTYLEKILSNQLEHNNTRQAFADGYAYKGQPIIISEYGGIAFNNNGSGWGYGNKVSTEEDFINRFEAITMALKNLPYVQGYCYTQVSDVEQEINGLLTPSREFKVNPEKIREINFRRGVAVRRIERDPGSSPAS